MVIHCKKFARPYELILNNIKHVKAEVFRLYIRFQKPTVFPNIKPNYLVGAYNSNGRI